MLFILTKIRKYKGIMDAFIGCGLQYWKIVRAFAN
jgi:hypothetical protein